MNKSLRRKLASLLLLSMAISGASTVMAAEVGDDTEITSPTDGEEEPEEEEEEEEDPDAEEEEEEEEDDGLTYVNATDSADIEINGEIMATVLSVTLPQSVDFVINPNGTTADERFITPEFKIINGAYTPIDMYVSKFEAHEDSEHVFEDVAPDKYTETQWARLNKAKSMGEIALGISQTDDSVWLAGGDAVYAYDVQNYTGSDAGVKFGVLKEAGEATMKLVANHGNALDATTCKYVATLVFGLGDEARVTDTVESPAE
jgi:hypothetical protein